MANIVSILTLTSILGGCVLIHIIWFKLFERVSPLAANGFDSLESDMSRRAVLIGTDMEPPQQTDCSIWEWELPDLEFC